MRLQNFVNKILFWCVIFEKNWVWSRSFMCQPTVMLISHHQFSHTMILNVIINTYSYSLQSSTGFYQREGIGWIGKTTTGSTPSMIGWTGVSHFHCHHCHQHHHHHKHHHHHHHHRHDNMNGRYRITRIMITLKSCKIWHGCGLIIIDTTFDLNVIISDHHIHHHSGFMLKEWQELCEKIVAQSSSVKQLTAKHKTVHCSVHWSMCTIVQN